MTVDDYAPVQEMLAIIERSRQVAERGEHVFFEEGNAVEFWAARMAVIDLDTAAERVSETFKAAHPDIPWSALARTRDKYAHHYEDIDRGVVWNLITIRLPRIEAELRAAIATLHDGSSD